MAETQQQKPVFAQPAAASAVWQKTELARHPQRPYPMDYIEALFTDFSEIHGDRQFGDDPAMAAGMARFEGQPVMVIGNLKGRTLKERVARKFGSPDPEGYRKALRAMKMADKFGHPVLTFIDLAGANPGLGAEERGQGEAIARNLIEMSRLEVPTIATITGEGGSGGALALAVADRVMMLENAIYSVISPEGCASIMWKDAGRKQQAASALRYTAYDVQQLGCVDEVIPEPEGGTHTDPALAMKIVADHLRRQLVRLTAQPAAERLSQRYEKFRHIARFFTPAN